MFEALDQSLDLERTHIGARHIHRLTVSQRLLRRFQPVLGLPFIALEELGR